MKKLGLFQFGGFFVPGVNFVTRIRMRRNVENCIRVIHVKYTGS